MFCEFEKELVSIIKVTKRLSRTDIVLNFSTKGQFSRACTNLIIADEEVFFWPLIESED